MSVLRANAASPYQRLGTAIEAIDVHHGPYHHEPNLELQRTIPDRFEGVESTDVVRDGFRKAKYTLWDRGGRHRILCLTCEDPPWYVHAETAHAAQDEMNRHELEMHKS